jgi:hypothetical protein
MPRKTIEKEFDMNRMTAASILSLALAAAFGTAANAAEPVGVVAEGGIRQAWVVADGTVLRAPGFPAALADRGESVCVAMKYRINPDGSTSDYALLRGWSTRSGGRDPEASAWDAYASASANALADWRFAPRPEAGKARAVDTVATMTFIGNDGADPVALRSRCAVPDLTALVHYVRRLERGHGDAYSLARRPSGRAMADVREASNASSAYAAQYR